MESYMSEMDNVLVVTWSLQQVNPNRFSWQKMNVTFRGKSKTCQGPTITLKTELATHYIKSHTLW